MDNLIIGPYCFLKSHLPFDVLNLNSCNHGTKAPKDFTDYFKLILLLLI